MPYSERLVIHWTEDGWDNMETRSNDEPEPGALMEDVEGPCICGSLYRWHGEVREP